MAATSTASRAWRLIVAGYSTAVAGLVAFLTINGASGVPSVASIGTAVLIAIGLVLPAAGMLQSRRRLDQTKSAARNGLATMGLGLVGLLFGVVIIAFVSSVFGYLVGAVFVAASGASAVVGAILLSRHYTSIGVANRGSVVYLILGTTLTFSGLVLIAASNIEATEYFISQVENSIYVDVGATVTAWGCVLSAYSFYVLGKAT
jgi:hypothetical protein